MNNKQYTITETAEKTLRYIGETDGNAMELNCRRAVADYALNGTLPEDKEISSRIAAIRFEIDRQEEEKRLKEEQAKAKARENTRKYDYAELIRLREEGKTLREIREETGATPPSIYHALKVRPKKCFTGMKSRKFMPGMIKRWR